MNNLKVLPAIVMTSSQSIEDYAMTSRHTSFDKGHLKTNKLNADMRKANHSTLLSARENKSDLLFTNRIHNKSIDETNASFDPLSTIIKLSKNGK